MSEEGKVYLIVPGQAGASGPLVMSDDSNDDQSILEKTKEFFGWRKELETDTSTVKKQINNYVTLLKG